jgi:hypothetical protein
MKFRNDTILEIMLDNERDHGFIKCLTHLGCYIYPLPPVDELKHRAYCKWYNSTSHATNVGKSNRPLMKDDLVCQGYKLTQRPSRLIY